MVIGRLTGAAAFLLGLFFDVGRRATVFPLFRPAVTFLGVAGTAFLVVFLVLVGFLVLVDFAAMRDDRLAGLDDIANCSR